MGIDIITREVELTAGQKAAITRFVNKNCSYYYFLNYIRMTRGNVKDAIMLYHFDSELRSIILKQILNFEIQVKRQLLDSIYIADSSFIWSEKKYYTLHFTYSKNKKSFFDKMVIEAQQRINTMDFSKDEFLLNERMLYSNSFGIFLRIYNNLLDVYRRKFIEDIYNSYCSFDQKKTYLKKYFESIQQIRNRCAHSNHLINKKMMDKIGRIYLDCFDEKCKTFNKFERTLYFLYKNTMNSQEYKKDIIKCLKKYSKCLKYCIQKDIFKPNIVERIEKNWLK